jgi:hypothetical protein
MSTPGPWAMVVLAAAAFRLWKLLADDTILDRQRDRFVERWPQTDEFIACPWCLGFWIGGALWATWWWWPDATLACSTPFALSAAVGAAAHALKQ